MIEQIIRDYLLTVLTVPVVTERMQNPPLRYCIIERTSENCANYLRTAAIAIQTYAESMYEAAKLCETVITEMEGLKAVDAVSGVWYETSYNFTDGTSGQYRYQAVFTVAYLM